MQSSTAGFAQPQVTFVGDLRDRETGPVECTRNHAPRTACAFAQDQIAKRITLPAAHRLHDRVRRAVLPSGWRVERQPGAENRVCSGTVLRSEERRVGKECSSWWAH